MPQTRKLSIEKRLTALEQRVTMLELAPATEGKSPDDNDITPYNILLRSNHFVVEVDHQHGVMLIAPDKERIPIITALSPTWLRQNLARWILEKQKGQTDVS